MTSSARGPGVNAAAATPSGAGPAAPSIYIFHGADAHALEEAVRRTVAAARGAAGPPVRFDGGAESGAVFQELYTSFLGGGRKVVILRDEARPREADDDEDEDEESAEASPREEKNGKAASARSPETARGDARPASGRDETPAASWAVRHKKLLQEIFDRPPEDAVFILVTPRWPLAGLTPPAGRAVVRGFAAPKDKDKEQQAPALVASFLAGRRKRIAADAIAALIDRIGPNAGLLAEAAEALALHAGERAEVTREDVEAFVQGTRPGNTFYMTRACLLGERGRALRELARLFAHAEAPQAFGPKTLGAIAWQYRAAARTCEALAAGAPRADALAASPWYAHQPRDVERLHRRLEALRGRPLSRAREWILDTDLAIKESRLSVRVAMEMLVVRLAGLP